MHLDDRLVQQKKHDAEHPVVWPPFPLYPQQEEWLAKARRSSHFNLERYDRYRGKFPKGHPWHHLQPGVKLDGPKNLVKNCHRQYGKDIGCSVFVVEVCMMFAGTSVHYLFPKAVRARQVWFENPLDLPYDDAPGKLYEMIPPQALLPGGRGVNLEGLFRFRNGSVITLGGMDLGSKLAPKAGARGLGVHIVVMSELSSDEVDRQILQVYTGAGLQKNFMILIPTTSNRRNHFYHLIKPKLDGDTAWSQYHDWDLLRLTWKDTYKVVDGQRVPLVTQEMKERFIALNSYEEWLQEYECEFLGAGEGAIYGRCFQAARTGGRMTPDIPIEPHLPTFTAWDLGVNNKTVVIYAQLTPQGMVHIVDCKEYTGAGLAPIAKKVLLWAKEHQIPAFETHIIPHDGKNRNMAAATVGDDTMEANRNVDVLYNAGLEDLICVKRPQSKIKDGIQVVKACFPRLVFDTMRCKTLIEMLEEYSYFFDRSEMRYDETKPMKQGQSRQSDFADALQTLCIFMQDILPDLEEVQSIIHGYQERSEDEMMDPTPENPSFIQQKIHRMKKAMRKEAKPATPEPVRRRGLTDREIRDALLVPGERQPDEEEDW